MADENYNMIKPVKNLQTIPSVSDAERRKQRKYKKGNKKNEQKQIEPDIQIETDNNTDVTNNQIDPHSIDYCA